MRIDTPGLRWTAVILAGVVVLTAILIAFAPWSSPGGGPGEASLPAKTTRDPSAGQADKELAAKRSRFMELIGENEERALARVRELQETAASPEERMLLHKLAILLMLRATDPEVRIQALTCLDEKSRTMYGPLLVSNLVREGDPGIAHEFVKSINSWNERKAAIRALANALCSVDPEQAWEYVEQLERPEERETAAGPLAEVLIPELADGLEDEHWDYWQREMSPELRRELAESITFRLRKNLPAAIEFMSHATSLPAELQHGLWVRMAHGPVMNRELGAMLLRESQRTGNSSPELITATIEACTSVSDYDGALAVALSIDDASDQGYALEVLGANLSRNSKADFNRVASAIGDEDLRKLFTEAGKR